MNIIFCVLVLACVVFEAHGKRLGICLYLMRFAKDCRPYLFFIMIFRLAYVCPCGWTYYQNSCYFVSKHTAFNWVSARAYCRSLGGDLALPTNANNNHRIFQIMTSKGAHRAWIGFYRVANGLGNNKVYTVTGVSPSYTSWAQHEPNNAGGKEDCVEMIPGARWNDLPCSGHPRRYVCQISFQRCAN